MNDKTTDIMIPEIAPELERGPQWLKEKRHASRQVYNATPVPPRGLHLWRYTDPYKFIIDKDDVNDTAYGDNFDLVEKIELKHIQEGHLAALATDFGGREIKFHGQEKLKEQGIVINTISQTLDNHKDLVERYLYQLISNKMGKFEALNGALWNDGIFIYVPDGVTLVQPIHLLREAGLENSAQFPRLLVVVGKSSELTIIDEYGGGSVNATKGKSSTNAAVEIFGLENSRTRYVALQRQASAATVYMSHRAQIENDANMLTVALGFGANISKSNFGVILNGPGAESNMYGLLFGSEYQHFDNHTLHHHKVGQTRSNIDFKVILRDKSVSAYTGLIKIDNKAKNCEAYQENRNLLLNKGTKAETIPELEILNEDVTCSHGATIGPIDPLMVFYLNSRGINREEATRMIVSGFVSNSFKVVPADLKERINSFVEQRLEHI